MSEMSSGRELTWALYMWASSHRRYTRLISQSITFIKDSLWWHWETKNGEGFFWLQGEENVLAGWHAAFCGLGLWRRGLLICLGREHFLLQGTCSGGWQRAPGGHNSLPWMQVFWLPSLYEIGIMYPSGYGVSRRYLFVPLDYSEVQRWDWVSECV